MKAILRQVRITPKKAHIVAGMLRGKKVSDALDFLKFTPKKAAKILYKVIASAAANAQNNFKQDFDHLYISEIYVTEGATYKRSMPVSRGRAHPILKRTAHIVVHLNVEIPAEKPKKNKKNLLTANV
ncbi:50S ribosomal protein L22 [Candidatus Peregrinibacteria bacterium]|nr:50S ribosomal protein L22 [Candidatus Peregrinibacteria bacterium]